MLDKIYNFVFPGRWLFNSLDSEPAILLDLLTNKFSQYLSAISNKGKKVQIEGVVLGFSSLYDCCFRCRNLIQGFQWQLEDKLKALIAKMQSKNNITLSDEFCSLVLFDGQKQAKTSRDPGGERYITNQQAPLVLQGNERGNKHQFAFRRTET